MGKKASLSVDELARLGQAKLASGHYKEAIDAYKKLLKQKERSEWREGLAQAYLGRAEQLAAKGMYKEAAVLWENRAHFCGHYRSAERYIHWLMLAGQEEKAARALAQFQEHLAPAALEQIQAALAAAILTGHEALLQLLPEDSPLVKHYGLAHGALTAYGLGDGETLGRRLKAIPFRSPYRDLRWLLTALSALDSDPAKARAALSKIASDSPFAGAARIVRVAMREGPELLESWSELGPASRAWIAALKGFDPKRLSLAESFQKAAHSPKALFDLSIQEAQKSPDSFWQRACRQLLIAYPAGIERYNRTFGALSRFEHYRVKALAAEAAHDLDQAIGGWYMALDALQKEPASEANRLRIALVQRRFAELEEKRHGLDAPRVGEYLEASLREDPDDKPTYVKLVQHYKAAGDNKRYRLCVERAVQQFPQDRDILLAALEAALERGVFKKAANFAKTLLELDPINSRARDLLIKAHLSHARKQIKAHKYDLARKELDLAQAMERKGQSSGIIQLLRGLLELAAGDEAASQALIEESCRLAGDEGTAYVRIVAEAARVNLSPRQRKQFSKQLKQVMDLAADTRLSKPAVLALVGLIRHYLAEEAGVLDEALPPLNKYFKKAAVLDYDREEMILLCETLRQLQKFPWLQEYAKQALARWPDEPLFVYYQVLAKTAGAASRMSYLDVERLERAVDRAMESQDVQTAHLIMAFLEQRRFGVFGFGKELERMADEMDIEPEEILNTLGEILFGEPDREAEPKSKPRKKRF